MQSHHQGAEVFPGQVLHLVDRDQDPDAACPRHRANLENQSGQVAIEQPRVGRTRDRIQTDDHVAFTGQLPLELKGLQHAKGPPRAVHHDSAGRQRSQRPMGQGAHFFHELELFGDLDGVMHPPAALGQTAELPEQHRLADTTQSRQKHAAFRLSQAEALDGHVARRQLGIATDERRRRAGARAIGVADRIHTFPGLLDHLARPMGVVR